MKNENQPCDVEEVEVMAREEDRISIVRGAKSSRGATSQDHEMLEQEAGGDVGESEEISWCAKKCAKACQP